MQIHNFELCIYLEDTDGTGVVYHPNYLKYMERARLELFKALGSGLEQQKQDGIYYVAKEIEIQYLKPAYLDDRLNIRTRVENIGRVQLRFHHEIDNLTRQTSPITKASINVVCVNQRIKPRRLPQELLEKIGGQIVAQV